MATRRRLRLSIVSIWVGILIPIVAALIPYIWTYVAPDHRLEYSLIGPISTRDAEALQLEISNNGRTVEKNVTVVLRALPFYEAPDIPLPPGTKAEPKPKPIDYLEAEAVRPVKATYQDGSYVLAVGDIRPEETVTLSITTRKKVLSVIAFPSALSAPHGIDVRSDERLAQPNVPSELEEFFYPVGFWMFILLMLLVIVIGVWQEYFMDSKTREKLILKEIDKLGRD